MEALVRRLRLHRPAPSPYEPSEAVAPAPGAGAGAGELFRPRRTDVLVCLFRGAAGELRVILTKRSSSLSMDLDGSSAPGARGGGGGGAAAQGDQCGGGAGELRPRATGAAGR